MPSQVRVKKENVDIYVYKRKRQYSLELGYAWTFDSLLLGGFG